MTIENRPVPHDIAAEEAVNGSLLIGGTEAFTEIEASVEVADFYNEANRWVFEACKALYSEGTALDQITIATRLQAHGHLEGSGGAAYLSHLVSIVPTSLDIEHYAEIVRTLATSRRFLQVGEKIQAMAQEPHRLSENLGKADDMILELRKVAAPADIVTPDERGAMVLERYPALLDKQVSLSTGLGQLDRNIGGGLFPDDLIIVAARPGVGKTSFMMTVVNNLGRNYNVLLCSIEMSIEGITDRDMAGIFRVPIVDIRGGNYSQDKLDEMLGIGCQTIADRRVYFLRAGTFTTAVILKGATYMMDRYGLDAIFVDYLSLLDDQYGNNNNERLGMITKNLKGVARTLHLPVMLLAQLSRASESRQGDERRPRLSDLRESGHIEEDADAVWFLYRQNYYDPDAQNQDTELIVAKQRQGENFRISLHFDKDRQQYFSKAPDGQGSTAPGEPVPPSMFQ